ncbi:hypothetical protein EON80_20235 [bacterium]|nr:MAG: hypothetical protein EON80_20235 [bacterium]
MIIQKYNASSQGLFAMRFLPLLLVAPLVTGGCLGPACTNTILQEIPSPDGQRKAVVFGRDCGATTGFNTQVSVLRAGEVLGDAAGNACTLDDNGGASPTEKGRGPKVVVKWLGPKQLQISFDKRARSYAMEKQIDGVAVRYQVQ